MAAKCSSCHADIKWAKTRTGKAMPLSVKSMEKRWFYVDVDHAELKESYITHFADCPQAELHRKPKDG